MFRDRYDAGRRLAGKLHDYHGRPDTIVLAIPRGGIVIGAEIARELRLPLDVLLVKKIGHPENSELAVGAASLTAEHVDYDVLKEAGISPEYIKEEIARVRGAMREQYRLYRGGSKPLKLTDKTVILTDDGAATGRTILLAIALIRRENPMRLVCALPVAPAHTSTLLSIQADAVVCLESPESFGAIGQFYRVFGQVEDEDAKRLLAETAALAVR